MSSSAIGFTTISYGPTGPEGNPGNRGPTGPTGATSGAQGGVGPNAAYIQDVVFYSAGATVEMSDGTKYSALGSFGGATTTDYSTVQAVDYLDPGIDALTYSFISSGDGTSSFIMRGISATGSLVITEDDQAIYIDSIYTPLAGLVDSASLVDNTLIYLKQNNQIASTQIGVTYNAFYEGALNFELNSSTPSFAKILPRSKIKYIPPTYKTESSQPVVLNTNDAGVFYVRTPNGISGFAGEFKSSEVVSFTLITESDDIWYFPSNVYFEDGENYLTCGKSILNLTSFDAGDTWYAVVAARGIDTTVETCRTRSVVGSCCYEGLTGTTCRDFVTRNECDSIAGSFHPLESCATSCGSTFGVCCSNGECLDNVSYAECASFGGKFFFGLKCGEYNNTGTNGDKLCYDRCQPPVACCKDGVCLGHEFTATECRELLGGTPFLGKECSDVDCCVENVKIGACCSGGLCSQATLSECLAARGVFLGEGESCDSVNCGCYPLAGVDLGTCCKCTNDANGFPQPGCFVTTEENCTNGTWKFDPDLRPGDSCSTAEFANCFTTASDYACVEETGACCYCEEETGTTTCENSVYRSLCVARPGIFHPNIQCGTGTPPLPCELCDVTCGDCVEPIPGVKCECIDGVKTCTNIDDISTDPLCDGADPPCVSKTSCSQNPCGEVIQVCNPDPSCDVNENESTTCNGTTDIIKPTCDDCFPDETIPAGSGEIPSFKLLNTTVQAAQLVDRINETFTPTIPFANNTDICVGDGGYIKSTGVGYVAMDYYIPIKEGYKCSNGADLQFCIDFDIPSLPNDAINSLRIYVLRTWYPKYFSTNMAAYQGLTFTDGFEIPYIDPANPNKEFSVWGDIGKFLNANNDSNLNPYDYYYNLSSFIREDGGNQINIATTTSLDNGSGEDSSININTVRMIEELNCPLYGYNPRGRYVNFAGPAIDSDTLIVTNKLEPLSGRKNDAGYTYAEGISYNNSFYYQSTNIAGRFGLSQPTLDSDTSNLDGINNQQYEIFSTVFTRIPLSYAIKNMAISNVYPFSVDSAKYFRSYGYTDIGYYGLCKSLPDPSQVIYEEFTPDTNDNYNSIGYYPLNATLNRFANTFINNRLYYLNNDGYNSSIPEKFIPYGFSNPGHPLTIDYEANLISQSQSIGGPIDIFRYDPANPYTNDTPDSQVRSPIYKTRHTSIICDSGVIDEYGNLIEDYNLSPEYENGHSPKSFSRKRKITGAINNPWYGSGNVDGVTVEHAETVISKTDTGIKLCIKLKNYRDYILTDDQIPTSFSDQYDQLMDSLNPRNKRFLNYKNSLRIVVFQNPYNNFADGLTFNDANLTDLVESCEKYTGRIFHPITPVNKHTFRYGCTNTSCSCSYPTTEEGKCNACYINDLDKETNAYGAADLENLVCTILGGPDIRETSCLDCVQSISRNYGIGDRSLGSIQYCSCAPGESINCQAIQGANTISALFNCRNCTHTTPCSCKTSSIHYPYDYTGGQSCTVPGGVNACDYCKDCFDPPPGSVAPPFGCFFVRKCGTCPSGCDLIARLGASDAGGAIINGKKLVQDFFAEYGYVENTDYWFADISGAYPLVVWKLIPDVKVLNSIQQETYSFSSISPPFYMVDSYPELPSYLRSVVCGVNTDINLPTNYCGISRPLYPGVVCTNFCEVNGEVCTEKITELSGSLPDQTFINNITAHKNDSDGSGQYDPDNNIIAIGSPCPASAAMYNFAQAQKKLYISETDFICVDMDCSSIDCSLYEDCAS